MRDLRRSEQGTLNAVAQPEAEGRPSAFLLKVAFMRILSIMIDESGNFDMKRYKNPLYCLTLVFHDQDNDIRMTINDFDALLRQRGYSTEKAIHTTPLIRKEPPYSDLGKFERKALFRMTASFINRLPIRYMTFTFDKSESDTYRSLLYKMARTLDSFIEEHLAFFHGFDRLILYYDKGQKEISDLLQATFNAHFSPNIEMRIAYQYDYKLLQAADFICTMEYIRHKWDSGLTTKSECDFFGARRSFIQDYYNKLKKLRIKP